MKETDILGLNNTMRGQPKNNKQPVKYKKKKKVTPLKQRKAPVGKRKVPPKRNNVPNKRIPHQRRTLPKKKLTQKQMQQHRNAQRKKLRRKRMLIWRTFQLFFALICVTSISYIGNVIYKTASAPRPQYVPIEAGVVDTSTRLSGVIIRDEELIETTDTEGVFQYQAKEGSMVNVDDPVCITTNHEQLYELEKQKQALDEQIFRLEKGNYENSYFYDELYFLGQEVQSTFLDFYSNAITKKSVDKLRNSLTDFAQKQISLYLQDTFDVTKELKLERNGLVKRMEPLQVQNIATSAGRISYYTDFLEDQLIIEELSQISRSTYEKALSKKLTNLKEQPKESLTGSKTPIYRIVKSDTAYILAFTTYETALEFQVGEEYVFNYGEKNEKTITLKLVDNTKAGKSAKLIFESTGDITELINLRSIELVQSRAAATGLIVPTNSIEMHSFLEIPLEYITITDNSTLVHTKSGDISTETKIELAFQTEEFGYLKIEPKTLVKVGTELIHPTKDSFFTINETKDISYINVLVDNNLTIVPVNVLLSDATKSVIEQFNDNAKTIPLEQGIKVLSNPNYLLQGDINE